MDKKEEIKVQKYDLNILSKKKYSGSYIKLSKEIEEICKKDKIKLLSINHTKNTINLKAQASMKKIDILIKKLEYINNYSNLSKILINKKSSNTYTLDLNITLDKYFIKDSKKFNFNDKNIKKIKFHLKAIISSYVFINSKWMLENETIDGYKIVKIGANFVDLAKKSKKIKLRIYKQ